MDQQGHVIQVVRPGINYNSFYSASFENWINTQGSETNSLILKQYMQKRGYLDGYFFYKGQRVWISTVDFDFFDQDRYFYSFGCHAFTIYLTRFAKENYSQFYGRLPSQAFDDAWFFPLFSNHFASSAIYSGNSGRTRTLSNSTINLLAINGRPVVLANEKFPYDGYEDPVDVQFVQSGSTFITSSKIQGDGIILIITQGQPTSIKFDFKEDNPTYLDNPSFTFTTANIPTNTTIYLFLMPAYWAQETNSVVITVQPSSLIIDKIFTVRTAQTGGTSFLMGGSKLTNESLHFPFNINKWQNYTLRTGNVNVFRPVLSFQLATGSFYTADYESSKFDQAFAPVLINPLAHVLQRSSVNVASTNVFYRINNTTSNFRAINVGDLSEASCDQVSMTGTYQNDKKFAITPLTTLTGLSIWSSESSERTPLWKTSRSGIWPFGVSVGPTIFGNTMCRVINPNEERIIIPWFNFNKVNRSGYTSSPLSVNASVPKQTCVSWYTGKASRFRSIHAFGDDSFSEGVRIRRIFVDMDSYYSFKGHYAQYCFSINRLTIGQNSIPGFRLLSLPYQLAQWLYSLGGSQQFNISVHASAPVLPDYFRCTINDSPPSIFCDLNPTINRNRLTIASISGGQSQYSPWLYVNRANFNLYIADNPNEILKFNLFFGNGGCLTFHVERCQ